MCKKEERHENKTFFHVFANGNDCKNLLTSVDDFIAAFNRVGICTLYSKAEVVCFALEDTHPHFLLYGTKNECLKYMLKYQKSLLRYLVYSRESVKDISFDLDILEITNERHLINTGVYIVNQATKDRKHVLPLDYRWSSGCLYFRPSHYISVWEIDDNGNRLSSMPLKSIPIRNQYKIFHTHTKLPQEWIVCNGIILPQNYINVSIFESIYKTHNCYTSFLGSTKSFESVIEKMSRHRGIAMETLEAREIFSSLCYQYYKKRDARWLNMNQRSFLARELRKKHNLTFKQLSALCRIPEDELHKYLR